MILYNEDPANITSPDHGFVYLIYFFSFLSRVTLLAFYTAATQNYLKTHNSSKPSKKVHVRRPLHLLNILKFRHLFIVEHDPCSFILAG